MMTRSLLMAACSCLMLASCSGGEPQPVKRAPAASAMTTPVVAPPSITPTRGIIPQDAPVVKVALLVPLSGESQSVGNAMMDAANLALHNTYGNTPSESIRARLILVPKDSGDTPADAARVAKQAIDQGAQFIIGPLFSQSVNAVAPLARQHNITMLTFSNNKEVAADGIYTFGFLPEQQVARMAEYAFLQNIQRVAVLAPNDAYGQKVLDAMREEMAKRGGQVSPSELYAPSPANVDAAVSRLAAAYTNVGEQRRFQAIFIADGGYQLKRIIASLKKTDIDLTKVKLIGTGQWDDAEVSQIPELSGAWFPSAPPGPYQDFERNFQTVYGYKPIRLASLAYDATALVSAIAIGAPQGQISRAALTDPRGYVGTANSLYRLRPDGTSERPLAVLQVEKGRFSVVNPAPKQFER
jgi:branched-chain amino acid transport system substrate-binding protein